MRTSERAPWGPELVEEFGKPAGVSAVGSSPRSRVWRVEAAGGRVFAVKRSVGGADAGERFGREVAALRAAWAAGPVGGEVVPAVVAADGDRRVMVLEWVDSGPVADGWSVGWARALARLHATGVRFGGGGGLAAVPRAAPPTPADAAALIELADRLGVRVPRGVSEELAALLDRLGTAAREGRALLHGDPCPGNDLRTASGVRFVDLEQALVGDGLRELAYLRIGFPSCWCVTRIAPEVVERSEAAYREEWRARTGVEVPGWPSGPASGVGPAPPAGLVDACVGWVLGGDALVPRARRTGVDRLERALRRDWRWGTLTARERLAHRLGVVAELTRRRPEFAAFHESAGATRAALVARFPRLAGLRVPERGPGDV
ncbi:aminoglycoside phosphotransferase family protein [Streptomyces sp. BI20]|uniref:aminoglycoside phosphotransferase family protein n=1 Tax=Streptomyces sp. BI20 TaxID=3403460 RepID=UPI003C72209F